MRNSFFLRSAAALAAAVILSGCSNDISGENVSQTTESITAASEKVTLVTAGTTTTTARTTRLSSTTAPEPPEDDTLPEEITTVPETTQSISMVSTPEVIEEYKDFVLSSEYSDFIDQCVFVGDSICRGLRAYEILPAKNVVAAGNSAARNIYDFTFKVNGEEMTILPALVELNPKYVVFWMGMNDVNMTTQQQYCENYNKLLTEVNSFLPDATLIVCSITPIIYTSQFTTNSNIDSFNAAIKEFLADKPGWYYADLTHEMKNSLNALKTNYDGGDGIHLAPAAYYAVMYQVCELMVDGKMYNADGTYEQIVITTKEPKLPPAEETAVSENDADTTVVSELDDLLSGVINLSDDIID